MDKQLAIRRVRIVASVFLGLLTLAILALCVRSRTYIDVAGRVMRSGYVLAVTSSRGELEFSREKLPSVETENKGFGTHSMYLPRFEHESTSLPYRIHWKTTPHGFRLTFPTWFLAAGSAAIACALWFGRILPARFSSCNPLVGTMLVAVPLGLGALANV